MIVVFQYFDPHGSAWPGPEGYTIETGRFTAQQKHPPRVVRWRGDTWVLETVVIDARPGGESAEVHYYRATHDVAGGG